LQKSTVVNSCLVNMQF